MKAKMLIGRRRFSRPLALRTSAPSAKHRHRNPKVKSMADTTQMDQDSAVPPRSEKEAERDVSRARKAAEDLRSAAGATGDKYRPARESLGRCAPSRPQFPGRQQAIRPREPDEGGLHR